VVFGPFGGFKETAEETEFVCLFVCLNHIRILSSSGDMACEETEYDEVNKGKGINTTVYMHAYTSEYPYDPHEVIEASEDCAMGDQKLNTTKSS
jgi:hypothetical protein